MSHDSNALDLETLASSLWECGATVPMAIASRLVLGVCGAVEAHGTSAEVTLERVLVHEDGDVHLARASTVEPAVCEPLVDVGIVAWELFVGRRFTLADVHPSGEVVGLVTTCARERALGALERRTLSAIDPLVARATAHDPSRRFASISAFARAFGEALPPAGRFSLVAWLCAATGPLPRAPFLTPRPPERRARATLRPARHRARSHAPRARRSDASDDAEEAYSRARRGRRGCAVVDLVGPPRLRPTEATANHGASTSLTFANVRPSARRVRTSSRIPLGSLPNP
jgi:hypothetical protein